MHHLAPHQRLLSGNLVQKQQQQQQQWGSSRLLHTAQCRHGFRSPCTIKDATWNRQAASIVPLAAPAAAAAASPGKPLAAAGSDTRNEWRQLLVSKALEPGQLVKMTAKGRITGDAASTVNIKATAAGAAAAPGSSAVSSAGASTAPEGSMPYKQLTMRPVLLKNKRMLQVSLLTARQDITKNFTESQAPAELQQLLQLPWSSASLVTHTETVTVQVSRKGKALVQLNPINLHQQQQQQGSSTGNALSAPQQQQQKQQQQQQGVLEVTELFNSSQQDRPQQQQQQQQQQLLISLPHDRVKLTPIRGDVRDIFLQKIGLQTPEGRIKANMQAKFTQINEFLKLLAHSGELDRLKDRQHNSSSSGNTSDSSSGSSSGAPVHILDAGCGSSHLTFGTFHYLHNVLRLPVTLCGVDTNRALMDRSNRTCADLGIADRAQFHTAAIRDFPQLDLPPPDIVLALHACDTATDEALAVGVLSGAHVIMSVPCCQKDIQRQFHKQQQHQTQVQQPGSSSGSSSSSSSSGAVDQVQHVFEPLLCHGILRQRQLDLLTDTFRAQLLRLAGYRTDVVEFVTTEHTPKNLLIRAVKQRRLSAPTDAAKLAQQYRQLRDAWGVRPRLESLLLGSLSTEVVQLLTQ